MENYADDDAPTGNVNACAQNGSDSNHQKHIVTPRRNKIAISTISRSEAMRTLKVVGGNNVTEIRSNHKMLARKYHLEK